jgi:hypothetical protein
MWAVAEQLQVFGIAREHALNSTGFSFFRFVGRWLGIGIAFFLLGEKAVPAIRTDSATTCSELWRAIDPRGIFRLRDLLCLSPNKK